MPADTLLIYCTCPDLKTAEEIAGQLVDDGLAACVNLVPGIVSIYQWQGERDRAEESLLLIKTSQPRYRELEKKIVTLHPYELPEIIVVPVEQGLPGYLDWVKQCTTEK
ncbi:divalent-cation tolerance protein CutA [Solemya velesiana gill symbiont]|uniref:Divalent-cation tolerance protein CutA n=1 Tax=Solemya velesiana gill symbiont TaxID=1918948 RepID=A0A1T2KYB6_9GAMM|nr:divalent-cation tolerance protein CutA [Solemya velesiana gill symbiont]OOZ37801.1 divalent-cation tolerance protein CutA [Solemya velesiana gill symbiont]